MNRFKLGRSRVAGRLLMDRRGSVAFEMLLVYGFVILTLLLPLADMAMFAFRYISAKAALRSYGQYLQYNPPADVTSTATWAAALKTIPGYTITTPQVLCGNTNAGAVCSSGNVTSPVKYFSYATTIAWAPMTPGLGSAVCGAANCSYTLPYTERLQ